VCPADLPGDVAGRAQEIALDAYRLFGCYGFARVDVMMDAASGELFVLEVNAIPGLTETSLLPQAAEAAGVGFDEVVARLIELALTRTART
jgi:D-alanine-D-alanine ligase